MFCDWGDSGYSDSELCYLVSFSFRFYPFPLIIGFTLEVSVEHYTEYMTKSLLPLYMSICSRFSLQLDHGSTRYEDVGDVTRLWNNKDYISISNYCYTPVKNNHFFNEIWNLRLLDINKLCLICLKRYIEEVKKCQISKRGYQQGLSDEALKKAWCQFCNVKFGHRIM